MQGKSGNHGVKGQPVSDKKKIIFTGQSYSFFRDSKMSFVFFRQGDPGERGLSGPLGHFGPKVRPLPVLSDYM